MDGHMFDGVFEGLVIIGILIGLLIGGASCMAAKEFSFKKVGNSVYVKYKGKYHKLSEETYSIAEKSMVKSGH
jgi:hypothetical protein